MINTANFALTSVDDPEKIAGHRADLLINHLNSLILHSSDAHGFDRIGKTLLWIKADPTFAGLKQVLNEPDARVFIGETPPNFKPDHKVISRLLIQNSRGWFTNDFTLDLNRDLVTVIGGRGSGKSALAEAIAFGAGSTDNSEDAFLKKATKHHDDITGTKIVLDWADGTPTEFIVGTEFQDHGLVQYLPQGAVEELCSPRNSDKLQRQIENVIFQALDETERLGASDFDELKSRILGESQHEKDQVVRRIRFVNKRLSNLIATIKGGPEKARLLEEKRAELDRLNKSLPELPPDDKKGQEELSQLGELRRKFETKIVELNGRLSKLAEVDKVTKVFRARIEEYQSEVNALLNNIGITGTSAFEVHMNDAGIKAVLDEHRRAISESLQVLKEGPRSTVSALLGISEADLPFENLGTR